MLHRGLCVHEIIPIGNCFYTSLHRKFKTRAQDPISHTREKTENHKNTMLKNSCCPDEPISSANMFNSPHSTPGVHISVGHDVPVMSPSDHVKLWSFELVTKVCHTPTLIYSRTLSLIWNVFVQEWRTCDAHIDFSPMTVGDTIPWWWHLFHAE